MWGGKNNTIGGSTPAEGNVIRDNDWGVGISDPPTTGNTIEGNVISGNGSNGVTISGDHNTVKDNKIGTNADGTAALPNGHSGVEILKGNDNVIEGNVISGNGSGGVRIKAFPPMELAARNEVRGNYIGTNADGTAAIPNGGVGMHIFQGDDNVVEGNVISGNSEDGVWIEDGDRNEVRDNYIGTNADGTAALPNGDGGVHISVAHDNIVEGNVISGNASDGVLIDWWAGYLGGNEVKGNKIGTNASGTAALPNGGVGVYIVDAAQGNTVGGTTGGERNVISGNRWDGVRIEGSGTDGNTVKGNYIGTNASGTAALPNDWRGVFIAAGAQDNAVEGNVISANHKHGVEISGVTHNTVKGNYIGTDASGTTALGNDEHGVYMYAGAHYNTVGTINPGDGNTIAFNLGDGVHVVGPSANNTIRGNSIHSNGGKGIALTNDGNRGVDSPTITCFGSVIGTACPNCTIDVYTDQEDEGEVYEGSTAADSNGDWTFSGSVGYPNVTATATDSNGNTSEFSEPAEVPGPTVTPVTPAPTPTPTPTLTATPAPSGHIHNCPEAGRWSIATWSGQDAMPIGEALAVCPQEVDAAYHIDPDTQTWTRYFHGRPEISNLATLDNGQGVVALGAGVSAASAAGGQQLQATADSMLGCPQPGKWAISVWSGDDGAEASQAFATCGEETVAAAYHLDPRAQNWLRWFAGRGDISNLVTLNHMQGVFTLGSIGPIVFRGWVVEAPTGGCSPPEEGGTCLWEVDVQIDEVIKLEQVPAAYDYVPAEVVTVVLLGWESPAPDLATGDYVEVSGEERLWGGVEWANSSGTRTGSLSSRRGDRETTLSVCRCFRSFGPARASADCGGTRNAPFCW